MRPVPPQETELSALDYAEADGEREALASLTACLALRGELKPMPGGGHLARSRGAFTTLADLAAVEAFARRVGA